MKRKTSTDPTRIWTFGALAPTANAERVAEQISLARKYRNQLLELELQRRVAVREVQMTVGNLADIKVECEGLAATLKDARAKLKAQKAGSGKVTEADSLETKQIAALLRTKREAFKVARSKLKDDPEIVARYRAVDELFKEKQKAARAASGLYWGTYLLIENAHEQVRKSKVDPKFRRWDGSGRVGVQLQGGLTVAEALSGKDTRLRIDPVPTDVYQGTRGERRRGTRTYVHLRVGTAEDGRTAIWATFPIILHRPLPGDATVKWAWVSRRRAGGTDGRWEFQLSLEAPLFAQRDEAHGEGVVALDIGWRQRMDDHLRVATWYDSEGRSGELALPADFVGAMEHARDLRSIRDKHFDAIKARLIEALPSVADEWLKTELKGLERWRSCARLAIAVLRWRKDHRFAGDEALFTEVDVWRKKDRHLYQWECREREKAARRRRDIYRCFAAKLVLRYKRIVVEDIDLAEMAELPEVEDGEHDQARRARWQRVVSGVGELRQLLPKAAVVKVDPAYTSRTCGNCGQRSPGLHGGVLFTCRHCGLNADRDVNAARNILLASGLVTRESLPPLETKNPSDVCVVERKAA